jgi:hypothetical protein
MLKNPRQQPRAINHEPNGSADDFEYIIDGAKMSREEAVQLEEKLRDDQRDLRARLRLIGYYRKNDDSKQARAAALPHSIWMADNRPTDDTCAYLDLSVMYTAKQFGLYRQHWLKQVELHPDDGRVIGNAAACLANRDTETATELFLRAQMLMPKKALWTRWLAHLYAAEAIEGLHKDREHFAELALAEAEKALKLPDSWGEHAGVLIAFTPLAIDFNHLHRAQKWTTELLKDGQARGFSLWIQTALLFQSRIELAHGRVEKAKSNLRKALTSIKENEPTHIASSEFYMLKLMNDLLISGERDSVIDALSVCMTNSYAEDRPRMHKLLQQAKSGRKTLNFSG